MFKKLSLLALFIALGIQSYVGDSHAATAEAKSQAAKLQEFKARNKGLYGSGLAQGKEAPDFTLDLVSGDVSGIKGSDAVPGKIQLSKITGVKPIIVVFGSYSCPPFRDWVQEMEILHQAYKDKAIFIVIYEREMHPGDVSAVPKGQAAIVDANTIEERKAQAIEAAKALKLTMPVLVDDMENSTAKAYHTMPMRNYIVDLDSKIAFRGLSGADRGPFGFSTTDTERMLRKLLTLPDAGMVIPKSGAEAKWAKDTKK